MAHHHEHKALHGLGKREDDLPNKNNFIHIAGGDNKYHFIHIAGGKDSVNNNDNNSNNENVVTVISQVYVTEPKTFPGPAVYITQTPVTETLRGAATTTAASQNSYESAKSVINQPKTRTHSTSAYSTPAYAGDGYAPVKGKPLSGGQISNQSHGMTAGAKAGVAIGVLAALGLVAGLLLFCLRRKKKQMQGEKLDEKHASQSSFFSGTAAAVDAPAGEKRPTFRGMASSHTASTAPRLSLRPVTQLLPSMLEKRRSGNNNNLDVPAMSEKPRSNPFGDDKQIRSESPANPFDEGDGKAPSTPNHSAKPSWETSDAGTPQVGTAAAVPIAAAGAPPKGGPNNVHRVQLDFKPSMDDELELKSGQLVRMIHEYDDGWALCMRMDRTQQGVCPRTCLSKLPVKPRPQGPTQGGRNSPPSGFRGPPPQGPNKMMPRPLTPTGRERSSTAGSQSVAPFAQEANRARSQSASGASDRAVSPIDSGMPARKPVPGQAM